MNQLEQLRQIIQSSDNIVFFGGAGVSTESNIPDFRSEDGLYHSLNNYGYPPEVMLSHTFFENHPQEFFNYYLNEMIFPQARPNPAHLALAKLEQQGKLKAVITQNIDGLHQMAGSTNVLELHGSVHRNYCLNCGAKYPLEFMLEHLDSVPHCRDCGCIVRPDVVLYEEGLDEHVLNTALRYIKKAEVLIVGGTSLVVYPAAGLLQYFKGRQLVLINKTATDYDHRANLVIHRSIGESLAYAVQ